MNVGLSRTPGWIILEELLEVSERRSCGVRVPLPPSTVRKRGLKPAHAAGYGSTLPLLWTDFGWRKTSVVKCELLDFALA